jgi:hypothetical protein
VDSVAVYYRSVGGRDAIEVMELDPDHRVRRVNVHYTPTVGGRGRQGSA